MMNSSLQKQMKSLYLYQTEIEFFNKVPQDIQKEFTVHQETLDFVDSTEKLMTRLSLARLHDPKLLSLRDLVQSSGDLLGTLQNISLDEVEEEDLSELFFVMGPTLLTSFITGLLATAKTDADILSISAMVEIRHSILSSYNPR